MHRGIPLLVLLTGNGKAKCGSNVLP